MSRSSDRPVFPVTAWLQAATEVPQPPPDTVPLPPTPHPLPPPPDVPPEVNDPSMPGENVPVRDPTPWGAVNGKRGALNYKFTQGFN